jgi:hypothetical protein
MPPGSERRFAAFTVNQYWRERLTNHYPTPVYRIARLTGAFDGSLNRILASTANDGQMP